MQPGNYGRGYGLIRTQLPYTWYINTVDRASLGEIVSGLLRACFAEQSRDVIRKAVVKSTTSPNHPSEFLGVFTNRKLLNCLISNADWNYSAMRIEPAYGKQHLRQEVCRL